MRAYIQSITDSHIPLPHETDTQYLLWLKARLDDGILYTGRGIAEQPEWYIDDMQYLSTLDYYYDLPYRIQECDKRIQEINQQTYEEAQRKAGVR